jgi:hypothetical protein
MMDPKIIALVRAAYMEGFESGIDHDNISYKYPPRNISWRYSEARKAVTGEEQPPLEREWYKNGEVTDEPEEA